MFAVPEHLLKKLKCATCGQYLTQKPIMVNNSAKQICGRCYGRLAAFEKGAFSRQIAFEAIAECLTFPCLHCSHAYSWNESSQHQTSCLFRDVDQKGRQARPKSDSYYTMPLKQPSPKTNTGFITKDFIKNMNNYKLVYNNHYETISSHYKPIPLDNQCNNCNVQLQKNERSLCLYGHATCHTCKGDLCRKCDKFVLKAHGFRCENRKCNIFLNNDELHPHKMTCPYRRIACPVAKCQFSDALEQVHEHFIGVHGKIGVFGTKTVCCFDRNDKELYFYCLNSLFVMKYYFNGWNEVEFVMEYIGNNNDAKEFNYRVDLGEDAYPARVATCAGWNESKLAKGVTYEIVLDKQQRTKLNAKISISRKE